jgi:Predicted membrane protein (DUF2339)
LAFWLFVSLVVALFALKRALTAEKTLLDQRRELVELRRMVQTLADRLGERWPGGVTSATGVTPTQQGAAPPMGPSAGGIGVDSRVAEHGVMPGDASAAAMAAASADASAMPGPSTAADSAGALGATPAPADPQPFAQPAASTPPEQAPPFPPPLSSSPPSSPGALPSSAPIPPLPRPAAARQVASADSLESAIGGRWLLYIGIAAIVLGASYFLKYAFDNEWIGEHTRVILGVVGGVALTMLGRRFVQRGAELYGQVLCGGGLGIVYLAIYAAHAWYDLIGGTFAFAAMVITTVITATLADQQRSQPLALFAVVVGFATPFLIGSERDNHIGLFTYDAILVAGTLFLARRRAWPALNLVSYVLTVATFAAWADGAYRPNFYVSVQFFLTLYVVLFLAILRENRRLDSPAAKLATMLLALAPVLYHFASLVNLRPRLGPLLVYLIAFTVAGIILAGQVDDAPAAASQTGSAPDAAAGSAIGSSATIGSAPIGSGAIGSSAAASKGSGETLAAWIRVLVFTGVALPFWGLAERGFPRGWVVAAWITLLAIYFTHLVAQINALSEDGTTDSGNGIDQSAAAALAANATGTSDDAAFSQPAFASASPASAARQPTPAWVWRLPAAEILLLHANGFWLLFCVQALFAPRALAWSAPLAFGLAAWYGVLAFAARSWHRDVALHATALGSAFAAIGFAIQFNGPWLVVALAAEGAVLVWVAMQSSRTWVRMWGNLLLLLAVFRALSLLSEPVPIGYWPLVNPRTLSCFFIVGILYAIAWMHARDPVLRTQPVNRHTIIILANVLTLVILSAEVTAYFDRSAWAGGVGSRGPSGAYGVEPDLRDPNAGAVAAVENSAALSRQLALSSLWALYAVALVAIGIWRDYRPIRYLAMVIFGFTITKVFFVDIATLDRVYKMLSVMVLGVLLLVASYLYQRLKTQEDPAELAQPPSS